jgi:hypothetical protein
VAVLSAFLLWPLTALEFTHHTLTRLHTALTKDRR